MVGERAVEGPAVEERAVKTAPEGALRHKVRPVPGSQLRGLGWGEAGAEWEAVEVPGTLPEALPVLGASVRASLPVAA